MQNRIENYCNLLETENFNVISKIIIDNTLFQHKLSSKGGVYAFWWIGDKKEFINNISNRVFKFTGKRNKNKLISIQYSEVWVNAAIHNKGICLYVGKSTDIRSRVSQHMRLHTPDIWGDNEFMSGIKPNSDSQLRIGLERIFNVKDVRADIIKNVAITKVEIDNNIDRFYCEDRAIGKYFPLLNFDIER